MYQTVRKYIKNRKKIPVERPKYIGVSRQNKSLWYWRKLGVYGIYEEDYLCNKMYYYKADKYKQQVMSLSSYFEFLETKGVKYTGKIPPEYSYGDDEDREIYCIKGLSVSKIEYEIYIGCMS